MTHKVHAVSHGRHETRVGQVVDSYQFVLRDRLVDVVDRAVFQRAVDAVDPSNKLVDVLGQRLVLGDVGACAEIKVSRRPHAIDATRVHQCPHRPRTRRHADLY